MAYMYMSDLWCDSCVKDIKKCLDREEVEDTTGDTDDYPQSVNDDGESDCPQHCAAGEECLNAEVLPSGQKIGCLIGTNLTSDGMEYVRDAVAKGGEVAEFWSREFGITLPDEEEEDDDD